MAHLGRDVSGAVGRQGNLLAQQVRQRLVVGQRTVPRSRGRGGGRGGGGVDGVGGGGAGMGDVIFGGGETTPARGGRVGWGGMWGCDEGR